jgi:hypothetical protein
MRKKILFGFLAVLMLAWIGGALYVRQLAPGSLFPPEQIERSKQPITAQTQFIREFRTNVDNQQLEFISTEKQGSRSVTLYFHGNSGRLGYIIDGAAQFGSVVSPSYPGYAQSEGLPTKQSVYETADVAMRYIKEKGYKIEDVTVLGHSLGGAVAVYAAEHYRVKKLILVNTFNSVFSQCWKKYYILCGFTYDIFNSGQRAEHVTVPVRQFHDRDDAVISFADGQELFRHFPGHDALFFEHGGKHNEFDVANAFSK